MKGAVLLYEINIVNSYVTGMGLEIFVTQVFPYALR